MPLEDLLAKVKDERRKEELRLKREHKTALGDLDSKKREELEFVKDEFESKLQREKQDLLTKKERQEKFELKMKRLQRKKELLEEAKREALKTLEALSFEEKKKIYLHKLEDKKDLIEDAKEIAVSKGKKKELSPILKEAGISQKPVEKELPFKEGFLVKGDRWTLEVTLENILKKEIERNKKEYINIFF